MDFVDYRPVSQFLPLDKISDQTNRFVKPQMDEILSSLIAKLYVTDELQIVVHKSFVNALQEVVNRKAKRGHDYIIFAFTEEDGWYIHARIDKKFISEEDVINE